MDHIVRLIEHYGLLAVFLSVLLDEAGLPVPSYPVLIVAAALAAPTPHLLPAIVGTAILAAMIADFGWYWGGRRYGARVLRLLCRIALSPDSCVRDAQSMFTRVGPVSLSFSKFIPGVSNLAVVLAGANKTPVLFFALFNGIGAVAYVGLGILLGVVFHDAIDDVLAVLEQYGKWGLLAIGGAFGLYVLGKWAQRRLFLRRLRIDRITVDQLRDFIDRGTHPIILDVRLPAARALEGIIPGSIFANPSELDLLAAQLPRDTEVVIYCSCPNEASAALAAIHLRKAGFKKIRPLLGGIDAWRAAGHGIETFGSKPPSVEAFPLAATTGSA